MRSSLSPGDKCRPISGVPSISQTPLGCQKTGRAAGADKRSVVYPIFKYYRIIE